MTSRRISPDATAENSPCVRNCCLDDADVCLGCGRSVEEILQWHRADQQQRQVVLALANERLRLSTRR